MKELSKNECYDCLFARYKDQIRDQKKYEEWMMGNTCSLGVCDVCGQEGTMLPEQDIERAVRASQGKFISSVEFD